MKNCPSKMRDHRFGITGRVADALLDGVEPVPPMRKADSRLDGVEPVPPMRKADSRLDGVEPVPPVRVADSRLDGVEPVPPVRVADSLLDGMEPVGLAKAGFSILEVLIALVVFSIGIGSLLTATGYHLRDISAAQEHGRAIRIAEREMTALRGMDDRPDDLIEGAEDGFSWTATVEELDLSEFPEMESNNRNARSDTPARIEVIVRWGENGKVQLSGFEVFKNG